jgi:glycopeptide antibiotics resistance protein
MTQALLAVLIGLVSSIVLFVPFVALSYRKRGGLTPGRGILWLATAVYAWAIVTYTLLPLPEDHSYRCAGRNLHAFEFINDFRAFRSDFAHPMALLSNPVVMQVALNVVLFIPLGFFVRVLGSRGVVAAGLLGLAISLLVEFTQLTGVWGIYPCAYRVFDVDDLILNTGGAVIGSLFALAVPKRLRGHSVDVEQPRPSTRMRRLVAMVCDWLGFTVVGMSAAIITQAVLLYGLDRRDFALGSNVATEVGTISALVVWAVITLATGRTVGDFAVRIRYGAPPAGVVLRVVRFLAGIGGYSLLTLLPSNWQWVGTLFALALVVSMLLTRDGRGLPGLITRTGLQDDRERPKP